MVKKRQQSALKYLVPLYKEKKLLGELDGRQRNALMTACYWGHDEICRDLIGPFIDEYLITARNQNNDNAMTIARDRSKGQIVGILMRYFEDED